MDTDQVVTEVGSHQEEPVVAAGIVAEEHPREDSRVIGAGILAVGVELGLGIAAEVGLAGVRVRINLATVTEAAVPVVGTVGQVPILGATTSIATAEDIQSEGLVEAAAATVEGNQSEGPVEAAAATVEDSQLEGLVEVAGIAIKGRLKEDSRAIEVGILAVEVGSLSCPEEELRTVVAEPELVRTAGLVVVRSQAGVAFHRIVEEVVRKELVAAFHIAAGEACRSPKAAFRNLGEVAAGRTCPSGTPSSRLVVEGNS